VHGALKLERSPGLCKPLEVPRSFKYNNRFPLLYGALQDTSSGVPSATQSTIRRAVQTGSDRFVVAGSYLHFRALIKHNKPPHSTHRAGGTSNVPCRQAATCQQFAAPRSYGSTDSAARVKLA